MIAANLQVAHGDAHAAPELLELAQRCQALRGLLGEWKLAREHEVGVGLRGAAAHAPLELIELRKAQALRVLDDQRVRTGIVDAALDDGRRHQHVDAPHREVDHHVFNLARAHLAVRHAHTRLGHGLVHTVNRIVDGLHAVAHVVHLPLAPEL